MIRLHLKALNLLPFIETECGVSVDVSPSRRIVLDVQVLEYIKNSVNKSIASRLQDTFNAFQTLKELSKLFGSSRIQDFVRLHSKFTNLRFKPGFDPNRFISDFDQPLYVSMS